MSLRRCTDLCSTESLQRHAPAGLIVRLAGPADVAVRAHQYRGPGVSALRLEQVARQGHRAAFADQHETGRALKLGDPACSQRYRSGPGTHQRVIAGPTRITQRGARKRSRHDIPDSADAKNPGSQQVS